MPLPINDQLYPWPYLSLFSRYGQFFVEKNAYFYPLFTLEFENVSLELGG